MKRILQLLFLLVETIIEVRNNPVFQKLASSFKWELGGVQFLKSNFFPAKRNEFYSFLSASENHYWN